jgi:hypothetical protein
LLTQRWTALQHITLSPSRIGDIVRAALLLLHFEHGKITHGDLFPEADPILGPRNLSRHAALPKAALIGLGSPCRTP